MGSTRYCKLHFREGESEHWALLDRKSFASKDAKPHFTPDSTILPRHLKMELYFDWDRERVWGTTTYKLEIRSNEASIISLDAENLEISKVSLDGKRCDYEYNGIKLDISLKRSKKIGSFLTLAVNHAITHPPAGAYFTKPDEAYPNRFKTVWTQGQDEDSHFYFPCFDQPNFKQTTEVILHLPPGMFGLSNGRLIREKHSKNESLFHYKLEIPYSTYLLSIVAGDFVARRDRWKNVDIIWYVQKGREKEGLNAFKDTAKMIAFFSKYTGYTYPYTHYTQIAVPEFIFGGMENFTVTTQTDLTLHDDRAHLDGDSNGLVAHEAAHMWFGDLITAKNWSHAWLHESFATYFDALYTLESKGEYEFRYQLLEEAETYFNEDALYRRPIVTHIYKEPIDLFDAHLYPGGAVRLHHLKHLVGEENFRETLKNYLRRHEFGLVETVDLFRCLEEVTAKNFDSWADQWIYRGGYPILDLGFEWSSDKNLATVKVKQTQKAEKKDDDLLFNIPFKLVFYFSRREESFTISMKNRRENFCFRLKEKPLFMRLDPDYECPCKKVTLDLPRSMLREQLKRDKDPIGRIEAAIALGKKASHEDVKLLSERLRNEKFWGTAVKIASVLRQIGGNSARDGLLRSLKNQNPKIRLGVVNALSAFAKDSKVARAVWKIAERDVSYRVEAAAFRVLGKIKYTPAREFLEQSIDRHSYNDMAQAAIFDALGELGDERSWNILAEGADYGAPKLSRGRAMQALAKMGKRIEHRRNDILDLLNRFCKESRGTPAAVFRGKLGAIQALQTLDDLSAIPVLRRLASQETDGRLQRRAEDAIGVLRESSRKPEEIKGMRLELDDLIKENKSLRDRVELIEKKETSQGSVKKKRKKNE